MPDNRLPHRMQRLIVLALREGWQVEINPNQQLTLRKPGFTPIYTCVRANDTRRMIQRQTTKDGPSDD